jgi:hypothetical protein
MTYDSYDDLDRPLQVTLPGGEVVRNCYDLRTTCSRNQRGFTTGTIHDESARSRRCRIAIRRDLPQGRDASRSVA